jgi:hypothetical protein
MQALLFRGRACTALPNLGEKLIRLRIFFMRLLHSPRVECGCWQSFHKAGLVSRYNKRMKIGWTKCKICSQFIGLVWGSEESNTPWYKHSQSDSGCGCLELQPMRTRRGCLLCLELMGRLVLTHNFAYDEPTRHNSFVYRFRGREVFSCVCGQPGSTLKRRLCCSTR